MTSTAARGCTGHRRTSRRSGDHHPRTGLRRERHVTTSTSPTGAVYDAADQITEAAAPQDTPTAPIRRSLYSYDKVGNLLVTTEPKGALTTTDQSDYRTVNTYDGIDQLTSVANHSGDTVSYVYDNVGNLVTTRDPKKSWG
ncbi:RHS repeat domain-containing protein [Streptomyces uncialis]|uniref:RHS repeat domain-containing protein n=1 Tax=Streptomyces uncialis TaxID=1048205 RepID=UPI002B1D2F5B|nr:RHS repeat domain-containing protein [Streptomyces uncialis]